MNGKPFWIGERKGRATERRFPIKILRTTRVKDDGGFTAASVTPCGPYWASVEPLAEKQRVLFQSESVEATHRVTVDGSVDVEEGDTIELNKLALSVMTVRREGERRVDKIIMAQEIRPGQER